MYMYLLVIYILVLILQIVLLVQAIRRKSKKRWVVLFIIELVSALVATGVKEYYDSLPGYGFMPGFSYLGDILFSFCASVLYGVLLLVSVSIFLVIEEKKKHISPFFALVGFLLWILGIGFLGNEILHNYDKTKSTGTIVGFEEVQTGSGIEQWPVIEFVVGEERYQDDYPMFEGASVGKKIKIYYYPQGDTYKCALRKTDHKPIYLPAILFGSIVLFIRRKKRGGIQ